MLKKYLTLYFMGIVFSHQLFAQALSYVDPASAYLRVMLEKGEGGTYQQIGAYKVTGTSYLFGEKLRGAVFAGKESGSNIAISYNTFTQELDIYLNGSSLAIIKPAALVDSFVLLKPEESKYIRENLFFYGSHILDSKLKPCFLQVIAPGKRFSLLKAYNSTLDFVSTNYVQSDLRQFSLEYTYFYYDSKIQKLNKLKLNKKKIIEAFKDVKDVSTMLRDDFSSQPEENLKAIIAALNE